MINEPMNGQKERDDDQPHDDDFVSLFAEQSHFFSLFFLYSSSCCLSLLRIFLSYSSFFLFLFSCLCLRNKERKSASIIFFPRSSFRLSSISFLSPSIRFFLFLSSSPLLPFLTSLFPSFLFYFLLFLITFRQRKKESSCSCG